MAEPAMYPPESMPVLFADGVTNASNSDHIVKFYFARSDQAYNILANSKVSIVAQVVMSVDSFMETTLFFQEKLQDLIDKGYIKTEEVDRARKVLKESA